MTAERSPVEPVEPVEIRSMELMTIRRPTSKAVRGGSGVLRGRLWVAAASAGLFAVTFGGCGGPEPRSATRETSSTDAPAEAGEPPAAADARPDTAADPDLLIRRIYDYGLGFGQTLEAIRGMMGPPTSADTTVGPNRHVRGAVDSLFVLRYPGLTFELNRPGPVEEDLLTSVSLSEPGHELPGRLRVGLTSREQLRRSLGPPDSTRFRADTSVVSYRVSGPAADRFVEFAVADDTVRRVHWVPYVD